MLYLISTSRNTTSPLSKFHATGRFAIHANLESRPHSFVGRLASLLVSLNSDASLAQQRSSSLPLHSLLVSLNNDTSLLAQQRSSSLPLHFIMSHSTATRPSSHNSDPQAFRFTSSCLAQQRHVPPRTTAILKPSLPVTPSESAWCHSLFSQCTDFASH